MISENAGLSSWQDSRSQYFDPKVQQTPPKRIFTPSGVIFGTSTPFNNDQQVNIEFFEERTIDKFLI